MINMLQSMGWAIITLYFALLLEFMFAQVSGIPCNRNEVFKASMPPLAMSILVFLLTL